MMCKYSIIKAYACVQIYIYIYIYIIPDVESKKKCILIKNLKGIFTKKSIHSTMNIFTNGKFFFYFLF